MMLKRFCDRCKFEIPTAPSEPGSPANRFTVQIGAVVDMPNNHTATDIIYNGDLCKTCWSDVNTVLKDTGRQIKNVQR
jgi:hypothetical protein